MPNLKLLKIVTFKADRQPRWSRTAVSGLQYPHGFALRMAESQDSLPSSYELQDLKRIPAKLILIFKKKISTYAYDLRKTLSSQQPNTVPVTSLRNKIETSYVSKVK